MRIQASSGLTLMLVLILLAFPLLQQERRWAHLVMQALLSLLLLASLYAVHTPRPKRVLGWILVGIAIAGTWANIVLGLPVGQMIGRVFGSAALVLVVTIMMQHMMRIRRVSTDAIRTAVAIYLVLGILFMSLFGILVDVDATAIKGLPDAPGAQNASVLYFSFVTLTTLGYGDITPVSGVAKGLATLCALIGQLYLTIMIARLVGLHIAETPSASG